MKTETLVKASATIVTITNLEVGNVYIRMDEDASYNESQLKYGVVTDILHNGENAAIVAIERSKERYGDGISVATKVFKTEDELQLYHVSVEAFEAHVADLEGAVQRQVREAEKALESKLDLQRQVAGLRDLTLSEPRTAAPVAAE